MTYDEYLTRIIDRGLAAARADYADPANKERLEGAVEGFESCRGKRPSELETLLAQARRDQSVAFDRNDSAAYWRVACRAAEIEWVCNCVGAVQVIFYNEAPIVPVTSRGTMNMVEVLREMKADRIELPGR